MASRAAAYGDVFGGVATTCSIPYLDLPPVAADFHRGSHRFFGGRPGVGNGGAVTDKREIFIRFGFGDFAVPYEDLFTHGAASDRDRLLVLRQLQWLECLFLQPTQCYVVLMEWYKDHAQFLHRLFPG